MEKKEIATENPVEVAGVTIIPVVEASLNYWQYKGSASFFCVKQPIAVVIVSPSERKAFRITGEEVPIDLLAQEVPSVKDIKVI